MTSFDQLNEEYMSYGRRVPIVSQKKDRQDLSPYREEQKVRTSTVSSARDTFKAEYDSGVSDKDPVPVKIQLI